MLNQPQIVTLRAFLMALVELESPLSLQLQQEINKAGEIFAETPNESINRLLELAEHDSLKELYWQARINLQKHYEIQERNKYDKPSRQIQATPVPAQHIANIAIPILQADNSNTEAKKYKLEIVPNVP